jgi:hypothetical protein
VLVAWSAAARADDASVGTASPQDMLDVQKTARLPRAPFQTLRYLEDYSYLGADDPFAADPFDPIKYVPLWRGGYLSFGGQHRLRSEYTAPAAFVVGNAGETALFSRNLLHADLHLRPELRLFAQAGAFFTLGAPARDAPPGTNQLDVTQAFVEVSDNLSGVKTVVRVGRQEMGLGSMRWVSVRDPTNMRRSFDMARISLSRKGWSSHTFFSLLPKVQRGVFDDSPDDASLFWGSYWTVPVALEGAFSIDAFYLGRSRSAVYREVSGREIRHTMGVRVFGKFSSGFEYIAHGLLQVGTIDDANILAWGTSATIWQRLPGLLQFARLGLRSEALSGDARAGDGRVTTFDPLFPNQSFFSSLPVIFPTNLYDLHPLLRMEHGPVSLEASWIFYWRLAVEDSVYQPSGPPLITPTVSSAHFTASQTSLALGYRATRNLSVDMEYSHLFAGQSLHDAGGRDIDYFGTWTTFTY